MTVPWYLFYSVLSQAFSGNDNFHQVIANNEFVDPAFLIQLLKAQHNKSSMKANALTLSVTPRSILESAAHRKLGEERKSSE